MPFKVNTPPVIHQTLDGEVIVVDLDSGTYFSIAGTGAEVWAAVEAGLELDQTIELMAGRYDADRTRIAEAVTRFVDELAEQKLIAPAEQAAAAPAVAPMPSNGTAAFEDPVLNRYTDMQELLMLDPIHEVDEQGWPNRGLDHAQAADED
ncbi:MAG TPA: PqqD family protein [Gaiellaceae bacterium]|jgi:hypothetical protein|nr:PqqD family protein [Gaiellaceae bacterium]